MAVPQSCGLLTKVGFAPWIGWLTSELNSLFPLQSTISQMFCVLRQWGPFQLIHKVGSAHKGLGLCGEDWPGPPWVDFSRVTVPLSMESRKWKLQITKETRWGGSAVRERELVPREKEVRIKKHTRKKCDNSFKKPSSLWKDMWEFIYLFIYWIAMCGPEPFGALWGGEPDSPSTTLLARSIAMGTDARFLGKSETT